MHGITCGATTTTLAVAVLLETSVSGLSPWTTTVFVCVPSALGLVTSVIVTVAPASILPMSQVRVAPPVQLPWLLDAETKVLPAGIGSEIVTPLSVLGPLFLTTIVQVMLPRPSCRAGEPLLVIERSTRACTQVDALDWSEPSFEVVTLPVLSTTPVSGQSPAVATVVAEVMCTVNVEAAWVVPWGTVAGPQDRTPAAILQLPAQPAPCEAIDQDRPGLVGSVSERVTPWASPEPLFETVSVNPIGSPTLTCALSAVFTMWIAGAATQVEAVDWSEPSFV